MESIETIEKDLLFHNLKPISSKHNYLHKCRNMSRTVDFYMITVCAAIILTTMVLSKREVSAKIISFHLFYSPRFQNV